MARFKVTEMNASPPIHKSIDRIMDRWAVTHQKLGHSRRVLVAELVTLFDLKCVPERRRNSANYDLGQSTISTATTLTVGSTTTKEGTRRKLRVRDYLEEDSWNEYLIVGRPLPTGYFESTVISTGGETVSSSQGTFYFFEFMVVSHLHHHIL